MLPARAAYDAIAAGYDAAVAPSSWVRERLWERLDAGLRERFRAHAEVRHLLPGLLDDVDAGRLPVSVAARRLLRAFAGEPGAPKHDD